MITVFQLSPNQDKDACAIPPYQCWKMSRFSFLFLFSFQKKNKNKNKSEKKADQLDFASGEGENLLGASACIFSSGSPFSRILRPICCL